MKEKTQNSPRGSAELRKAFLDYFQREGHTIVPSASLVPGTDPTLLFTNAGMVPFKDVFLGTDIRAYKRATSSQRCVRAGGKHNDLEEVGHTARHHTFFEMLGNFSFGDYFKREAINFGWNFLTKELGLPPEKLWVTVYEKDTEAADIWLREIGVSAKRFSRCGDKDNFWAMGDTGPCGPCTEIFYDHGPDIAGGPPGTPEEGGDRYIEIWNLVFMQYDRAANGELKPLPKPSVDTGMGLERLAAVMQGVHNNYDTDLFRLLLQTLGVLCGREDVTHPSMRVIVDHIRSCSFLIADGVVPSNEGRGYVLRRIIRRAIRHGHKLGLRDTFFYKLVAPLVVEMGEVYPLLAKSQREIERILLQEEEQFNKTLDQGLRILEQDIVDLTGTLIPGSAVFRLYDTYGFPPDLTADIARERGLQLDMEGFEQEMQRQREQSQSASKFVAVTEEVLAVNPTEFSGYDQLAHPTLISALFFEGREVSRLQVGQEGMVVLEKTPFYAESGGQVGDQGQLKTENAFFVVTDTKKQGKVHCHYGYLKTGNLSVGDVVGAEVDLKKRQATALNHTATHLLHAALRQVLGTHVVQKGSLVDSSRLRFDFSHFEAVTPQQLHVIERLVNQQIRHNTPVKTAIMTPEEAIAAGAMALFGEKYDEKVRVLHIGEFSKELCGGTHASFSGDIGLIKITSESGVAAGVRRIEAVTGEAALDLVDSLESRLAQMAAAMKVTNYDKLMDKLQQLLDRNRTQEKELTELRSKAALGHGEDLAKQAEKVGSTQLLTAVVNGIDVPALRQMLDQLKSKLGSAIIVLASVQGDRIDIVAGVSKDQTSHCPAGELVNLVATQVGGKGGGRPDMAQGAGNRPDLLAEALSSVKPWLLERLR